MTMDKATTPRRDEATTPRTGKATAPRTARRERYHHGDLRAALIDTAVELLGERGLEAFSMAEASRRLGVAVSAPYRHFADRDALLAAVAVRAAELLADQLDRQVPAGPPAQRLAAAARTYVRFASDHRPLFQALAGSGLDKDRHPEIARAAQTIGAAFTAPATELADGDEPATAQLALAIVATAHGHATLMLDGTFGTGDHAVEAAAEQAAAAALALIAGREALSGPALERDLADEDDPVQRRPVVVLDRI
jgi:AcrR family transcriptional regulator